MSLYIPEALRVLVAQRAGLRCEYCRLPQQVAGFSFAIDHIISLKHGGKTAADNLAYSCPICNGNKGSDLGSVLPEKPGEIIRFFNPRTDDWFEQFDVHEGVIIAKTEIASVTIKIFDLNREQDVIYRRKLVTLGLFP